MDWVGLGLEKWTYVQLWVGLFRLTVKLSSLLVPLHHPRDAARRRQLLIENWLLVSLLRRHHRIVRPSWSTVSWFFVCRLHIWLATTWRRDGIWRTQQPKLGFVRLISLSK